MDWRKMAVDDLENYKNQKESLENIKQRIEALNSKYESLARPESPNHTKDRGIYNVVERAQERMIENIMERQRLSHVYNATEKLVLLVERGLNGLPERDRRVLELFYVDRPHDHIGQLMEELNVEKSTVYRMKDEALYKFTARMYGLSDY
jgi:DNA-directed RNA polymerase specialized sigma subunit